MSATLTKREIERRVSAVKATGLEIAGVRFDPAGGLTVLTVVGEGAQNAAGGNDPDDIFEQDEKAAAARRARGGQAARRQA